MSQAKLMQFGKSEFAVIRNVPSPSVERVLQAKCRFTNEWKHRIEFLEVVVERLAKEVEILNASKARDKVFKRRLVASLRRNFNDRH